MSNYRVYDLNTISKSATRIEIENPQPDMWKIKYLDHYNFIVIYLSYFSEVKCTASIEN